MSHDILIVDDDRAACMFMAFCVSEMGHTAHLAHAGQTAMEQLRRVSPACVLLDCHLGPVRSGLSLIEPFHRLSPETPIVMISADASWEWGAESLARGAFMFWRKASGAEELTDVLASSLEEYAVRRAGASSVSLRHLDTHDIQSELQNKVGNLSQTANDLGQRSLRLADVASWRRRVQGRHAG